MPEREFGSTRPLAPSRSFFSEVEIGIFSGAWTKARPIGPSKRLQAAGHFLTQFGSQNTWRLFARSRMPEVEGQSLWPWLEVVLIGAMNYEKGSVFLNLPKRCVGSSKIARIAGAHTNKLGLPRPIDCSSRGVAARESDWLRTE